MAYIVMAPFFGTGKVVGALHARLRDEAGRASDKLCHALPRDGSQSVRHWQSLREVCNHFCDLLDIQLWPYIVMALYSYGPI